MAVVPAVSVTEWHLRVVLSLANQHKMRPSHRDLVKLEVGRWLAHKNKTLEEVSLSALRVSSVGLAPAQVQLLEVPVEWAAHLTTLTPT